MNAPRSINSTKPFVSCAQDYIDKGWSVLPLPRRRKEWPPTGFTGRAGKFADDEDLRNWLSDPQYSEGNIAIRVGNMLIVNGVKYEVIGIDVDNHSGKPGAKDLAFLEKTYGKLPDTWTSSSRDDGVSGIRFYLVPYGYGFKGKTRDSIDIIQRVHRYAVVYPSWHPDTKTQYFWYEPGKAPSGQGFTQQIPNAKDLPLLPDGWIDHLTAGRTKDDQGYGADLDSTDDEIKAWRKRVFNPDLPDVPGGMCPIMERAVAKHIEKIENSASNHDKIIAAHWHLITLAAEGHSGLRSAIEEVEAVWIKDIMAKDKRPLQMVKREITRSLKDAFRKVKAKADAFAEQGFQFFSTELCPIGDFDVKLKLEVVEERHWVQQVSLLQMEVDPLSYDKNDVSQAQHFYDRVGDNVRYLADYNGWIIYDGNTWHIDDFAHVRDLFDRAVVKFTIRRVVALLKEMEAYLSKSGNSMADPAYEKMEENVKRLNSIVNTYRNDPKIKAVLNCMKSIPGVGMKYSELNWDTSILAMPNGKCIKLDEPAHPNSKAKGFRVIDNDKAFFTTMSTAVELLPPSKIDDYELKKWNEYLELFLPDVTYRRFVQKALGYILFGGNPDKLALFLVGPRNTGKSTILQCIQEALKDYGATFQPNSVFKDSGTGTNPELGNLLHKRGIFSSESGSQRIYANPLKRNTGGDKISVTRKYANSQIIGIPHFVPVVATNQAPTIEDADEALVKRIMVLPFITQVDDAKNDKRADVTLARDAKHAILLWLIKGYRLYVREGLSYDIWPDSVKAATLEFASELSDVSTFLNELCLVAPDHIKTELLGDSLDDRLKKEWAKISVAALYDAYVRDTEQTNQKPLSKPRFGKKVRQMFGITDWVREIDGKSTRMYLGLKWRNETAMSQIR